MKFILDVHCHTIASGHAYSTVTENALSAYEKGLELIAVTDHAPKMPGSSHKLYFSNLHVIPKYIKDVEILKGAEVNILDKNGTVDLNNNALKKLDIVIASLHIPCIAPMTKEENTQAMINTMKNPNIHILGHPGDPRYPFDIKEVVYYAKKTNTAIEINNTSLNPLNPRFGGTETICTILEECVKQNTCIVLGSDAHYCSDIGNFSNIEKIIENISIPENLILNTNKELLKKHIGK